MKLEETFDNLTDAEKVHAKAATSMAEIEEIAEDGGMPLSLDDLDAAAGGVSRHCRTKCPWDE